MPEQTAMTESQRAEFTRRVTQINELNQRLLRQIEEAQRLLKTMRSDAKDGHMPRYTLHLLQHVQQMAETHTRIETLNGWTG